MTISVYKSASKRGIYGLSADRAGASLPSDLGPWVFWKSVNLGPSSIGVDHEKVEADIARQGFHIATPLKRRQSS